MTENTHTHTHIHTRGSTKESLAISGVSPINSTYTIGILKSLPDEASKTVFKDKKRK